MVVSVDGRERPQRAGPALVKNDGKDAEKAFVTYWSTVGHLERIRDKKDLMGLNGGKNVADFPKPSDFLVSAPGVPLHYAEVKSTIDNRIFAFGKIRPGQASAAKLSHARGDGAYKFYIFSYPLGLWFVMTAEVYVNRLKAGHKSILFEDLPRWEK